MSTYIGNYTGNIIVFYLYRCINNIRARKIRRDFSVKGKPWYDRCPIKATIILYEIARARGTDANDYIIIMEEATTTTIW